MKDKRVILRIIQQNSIFLRLEHLFLIIILENKMHAIILIESWAIMR